MLTLGRLLILLVAGVALLSGCHITAEDYTGITGPLVYFHADSLGDQAQAGIENMLEGESTLINDDLEAAGYNPSVNVLAGQRTDHANLTVTNWPADLPAPKIAVFALGSNDLNLIGEPHDEENPNSPLWTLNEVLDNLDAYLLSLDALGVECIAAFTVSTVSAEWGLDVYGPIWNEHLRNHPLVDHVEPWHETFVTLETEDQVHYLNEGHVVYREHVVNAVEACNA